MDSELCRHAHDSRKNIKDLLSQLDAASEAQISVISKFDDANKQLNKDNESKDQNIKKLEGELYKLKEEMKSIKARTDHGDPKTEHSDSDDTLKRLSHENHQLQHDIEKLKETVRAKDGELGHLQEQLAESNYMKIKLETSTKYIEQERDALRRQKSENENVLRDVERQRDQLRQQLINVENENGALKQQIDKWVTERHKTVHVQMYAAVNKELCEKMMGELEEMLSMQFELNNLLIKVDKFNHPPEDSSVPLLVLCINASRLGTDVNQALQKVNRSRTTAVVVLHHKEIHALPRQPSEKLLIGSDYKDIGVIVDIAYLTTKGIYPCDMNNKSLDRLVNFIRSHSQM